MEAMCADLFFQDTRAIRFVGRLLKTYLRKNSEKHMNGFAIRAYLRHWLRARRRGHGVHSPFVYALAREVFPAGTKNDDQHPAEQRRKILLSETAAISVTDFGTGNSGVRQINTIAQRSAKPPKQAQLLQRIVQQLKPQYMLELGTSFGLTTLYEVHDQIAQFTTIEGCPEIAAVAEETLKGTPVKMVTGDFDEVLPEVLKNFPRLDYVYFDGNHRRDPTLRYFEYCLPLAHNETVFVFDDIHWSAEMESAWETIKAHPRVQVTIDLFHFGLVFFRQEQVKEHFVLKV
jgi:predicted O-methyltransferase YrrM